MKKYVEIAKIFFKSQMAYRFDVAITALEAIGRVLFAWLIWGAVFIGRDTVSGFTFQAMLLYYVVSSFLLVLDNFTSVSSEVSGRIRGGTFSKYMVIPANPISHFWAQTFGIAAYYSIFALPIVVLSGFLFGAGAFTPSPMVVLCALIMIFMGMTFMVSYHFFIGLLAFKFNDVVFFLHLQGSVISFTQGGMIPLNLLPEAALNLLRLLPFPHAVFTPTMLLTGNMDLMDGLSSLGVLAFWTIGMAMVSQFAYNRLRIKYDGVGV